MELKLVKGLKREDRVKISPRVYHTIVPYNIYRCEEKGDSPNIPAKHLSTITVMATDWPTEAGGWRCMQRCRNVNRHRQQPGTLETSGGWPVLNCQGGGHANQCEGQSGVRRDSEVSVRPPTCAEIETPPPRYIFRPHNARWIQPQLRSGPKGYLPKYMYMVILIAAMERAAESL
jgi:hypothetical protein